MFHLGGVCLLDVLLRRSDWLSGWRVLGGWVFGTQPPRTRNTGPGLTLPSWLLGTIPHCAEETRAEKARTVATHSPHPSEQDAGDQVCAGASESYVFTSQHLTDWGQMSQGPGGHTPWGHKDLIAKDLLATSGRARIRVRTGPGGTISLCAHFKSSSGQGPLLLGQFFLCSFPLLLLLFSPDPISLLTQGLTMLFRQAGVKD